MITEVAKAIFPPDLKPLQIYRVSNFAVVMLLVLHVLWACGFLPGLQGFALAAETDKIRGKVDTILMLSLEDRMRGLSEELCKADPIARRLLQREIDNLQSEHKNLVGEYYTLIRSCEGTP